MTIVCYTVNNYILGNKIPRIGGKIVTQKRIDKTHTDVTVEFATKRKKLWQTGFLWLTVTLTGNVVAIQRKIDIKNKKGSDSRRNPALLLL